MDTSLIIPFGALLGCVIALSWFAGSDAPYVPTKMNAIRKILKLAGIKNKKKFYELGSGDGRVVLMAAKLGAIAIGIEQSLIRVFYSRFRGRSFKKAQFIHGNIFDRNYNDADIIYIYLLPKGVKKLEEKLQKELKKGAIIITQTYHFPTWKPFRKLDNFWLYRR